MRVRTLAVTTMLFAGLFSAPALAKDHQDPTVSTDPAAAMPPGSTNDVTGGAAFGADPNAIPEYVVAGDNAVLLDNGMAAAPANAPDQVKQAIWAANHIQSDPYVYGGGHGSFDADTSGYDCSGTVSYALHGGGLLKKPRDSSDFMRFGKKGNGQWITIYTKPSHAYMVIAGLRLDTSSAGAGGGEGPRWRSKGRPRDGYTVRHPTGF